MLQRCAGELVQSSLNRVDGKISPAGVAQLTESLQNDPLVRGKLAQLSGTGVMDLAWTSYSLQ